MKRPPRPDPMTKLHSADAAIACTLDGDAMPSRRDEWQALLGRVVERSAVPGGIRLSFDSDAPIAEIARLAQAEQACCAFFAFRITVDDRGVALEATGPPDAQPIITDLFGSAS
jgi:hypothetical protein